MFSHGHFNNNRQNENLVRELLGGTNNNSVNPLILGNAMMHNQRGSNSFGSKSPINMVVQNWLTSEEAKRGAQRNRNSNNNNNQSQVNLLEKLMEAGQKNQQKQQSNYSYNGDPNQDVNNLAINMYGNIFNHGNRRSRRRENHMYGDGAYRKNY
jgi:hypothetical protein